MLMSKRDENRRAINGQSAKNSVMGELKESIPDIYSVYVVIYTADCNTHLLLCITSSHYYVCK